MLNEFVLVIGGASPSQGQLVIDACAEVGIVPIILDTQERITVMSVLNNVITIPIDYSNFEDVERRLVIRNLLNVSAAISITEKGVELAAYLSQHTKQKNSVGGAKIVRNKLLTNQVLTKLELTRKTFVAICSQSDLNNIEKLTMENRKWIVKPISGQGSEGVQLVTSQDLVQNVVLGLQNHSSLLVEEFIEGKEFSCEGHFANGRACIYGVSEKVLFKKSFVERGHVFPFEIGDAFLRQLKESIQEFFSSVGIMYCPFHIEFWVNT